MRAVIGQQVSVPGARTVTGRLVAAAGQVPDPAEHDVAAAPLPDQPHVLGIAVAYRIKATNDRRNLVFPFYSIPEE